ncbi:MAG: ABC transporter permease [Vicinamibacterales bacterium]
MRTIIDSLRHAARVVRAQPGFALTIVLALALGIGANCALFAVVNSLLLRPLPYRNTHELVEISLPQRRPPLEAFQTAQSLSGVASAVPWGHTVQGPLGATNMYGFFVSPNLFSLLGVQPAIGRVFSPDEKDSVVILGYDYWRRTSGDPHIIGQVLTISGRPHTIVGVLAADFSFSVRDGNLFVPGTRPDTRIVARLKPGATVRQAQAEAQAIAQRFEGAFPGITERTRVIPIDEAFRNTDALAVLLLQATVAMVLLITCANVGNLLLVRAAARRRELAIRTAIGAGRTRLFWQLMAESALLAVMGGALGLLIAGWSLGWLETQLPANLGRRLRGAEGLSIDATVLLFTFGLSILVTFLFGLAPALTSLRSDVISALREAGNSTPRRHRFGQALLAGEVALALMLLIGAGLTLKSLIGLQNANLGFSPDHVLRVRFELQPPLFTTAEQRFAAYTEIIDRAKRLPGVESVGAIAPQLFPFGGPAVRGARFALQGRTEESARAEVYVANPDYFRAVRIPLLKGRLFTVQDTVSSPPVALISEIVATRYWGDRDPLGSLIQLQADDANSPWATVIGVVGNVRNPVGAGPQPTAYRPYAQSPAMEPVLMIRTAGDPMAIVEAVRSEVRAVNPKGPDVRVADLQRAVKSYVSPQQFTTTIIGFFAGIGLLLAAVGVYGVTRHWVGVRTFEIGVRMALGAQPGDVLRLVLGTASRTAMLGIALGIAGALALQRVIASQLFGVSPTDPVIFVLVAVFMTVIVVIAALLPARWATRVNPLLALRRE